MAEPPFKTDPGSDNQGFGVMEHPSLPSGVIDQLIRSSSVLELEAGVQVGLRLIDDLKEALNAGAGNDQAAQWLQYIQQVEAKVIPARTVIGVV